MKIVDINVLIYAINSADRNHRAAAGWLAAALQGSDTVGFSWSTILGFVRICTNPAAMQHPLTVEQAFDAVQSWLASPKAVVLEPTARHLMIMKGLLVERGTAANLTSDAHLAALAIEYGGSVATFDRDVEALGVTVTIPTAS
ncbi:type II toxin-antitoxin system VapC family toxin [Microlunatus elymi]|uniref:Ribonuclease VapC n=1 Tax=Microlunatus elymi TaxID=2596828 RepID=A0A516Q326_9ACTN|nr:TA system VapC family ribonuclease toxin [Microlunatus elymi]QDP97830.1 type II toxin-antitoxin system VapC family toxin [Microlunatus elymi]